MICKMFFQLKQPDLDKVPHEELAKILSTGTKLGVYDFVKRTSGKEYLYWDKFSTKEPSPKHFSKEALWIVTKAVRQSKSLESPIKDKHDKIFTWSKLDYFEEFFHELDMNTGGELFITGGVSKTNKQKLVSRGIMEEAIASSQLEGANTSRQVAKQMLREGRKPRNRSEQMIVNSYLSMKRIEEDYKDKAMSMELILELHSLITDKTEDSEGEIPRLRKRGETIYVTDKLTGLVYHEGPDIAFVKKQFEKLIIFANDQEERDTFIHPVIKAIMLHFWMGYLHPFTDGNGRLARMLFYWYLIKKGYWAFVYLPISKIIKKSPDQYKMAYLYSEQDDNDLSYFIDYNIRKIKLAVKDFNEYLNNKSGENTQMKRKCELAYRLNDRQAYLLQYLQGDPDSRTSLQAHMNINQVSKITASKDLKDLLEKGFLHCIKKGRNKYYFGSDKITELFKGN